VFSGGLVREQRACHGGAYAERFQNSLPVGHASGLCLLENAERALGQCRVEAAKFKAGDDGALLGDGSFPQPDVLLRMRETGAY
jgi:hypothetical protein